MRTQALQSHENLYIHESAERMLNHFSSISQEIPPLQLETLPERVLTRLQDPESESTIPELSPLEVYESINAAKNQSLESHGIYP